MNKIAPVAIVFFAVASPMAAQAPPFIVPPSPPAPQGGTIECDLKDLSGGGFRVLGDLGWSISASDGLKHPRIRLKSERTDIAVVYHVKWSTDGGELIGNNAEERKLLSGKLHAATYKPGVGTLSLEISPVGPGASEFLTGFCNTFFSRSGGIEFK